MVDIPVTGLRAIRDRAFRRANPGPVTKAVHVQLSRVWRESTQAFVKAAVREILIETGMSAASLFPLARVVRGGSVAVVQAYIQANRGQGVYADGRPKKRSRKGIPEFPTGRRSPGTQNPAAGKVRGQRAFSYSTGSPKRPVFTFVFQAAVFQFAQNEQLGNSAALEIGREAFLAHYNANALTAVRLVIREYLRGKRILGAS